MEDKLKKSKLNTYRIEPERDKRWVDATYRLKIRSLSELIFRAVETYIK